MVSLVEQLVDDLLERLGAAPNGTTIEVLLWPDHDRGFTRIASAVSGMLTKHSVAMVTLDAIEPRQLALKLDLLRRRRDHAGQMIVYLPGYGPEALAANARGEAPALWSVCEMRYVGVIWGRTKDWAPGDLPEPMSVPMWLRAHGVSFVGDAERRALMRGGADSELARYLDHMVDLPLSAWPQPVRREDVLEALGGDPDAQVRDLLIDADAAVANWKSADSVATVLARLSSEFGLEFIPDSDPDVLADAIALHMALVEAWDAFGRPDDFPFGIRIPKDASKVNRTLLCVESQILAHQRVAPRYLRRVARLEPQYDLTSWATGREGYAKSFKSLAVLSWKRFLSGLSEAAARSQGEAVGFLWDHAEQSEHLAGGHWDGPEGETHWYSVQQVLDLLRSLDSCRDSMLESTSLEDLVTMHVADGWKVDHAHLEARALAGTSIPGLETLRTLADGIYFEFVEGTNDRFAELLEAVGAWQLPGLDPVSSLSEDLWTCPKGRRGVLIVDACRLDLAMRLVDLSHGVNVTPLASTLPTTTPFGMTALLPVEAKELTVQIDGQTSIRTSDGTRLHEKNGRKTFIEQLVKQKGAKSVGFIDLGDLLDTAKVPDGQFVVVFDQRIDEQGHKGAEDFPQLTSGLTQRLYRAINLLHEAGIARVDVVTDHGFLFLPPGEVDALGHPDVLPHQSSAKDKRWAALKAGAPVDSCPRYAFPLAPDVVGAFPRGVRTLVKAERYMHGGISLQECVIPHIVSRSSEGPSALSVDVSVSETTLHGGTVAVSLRPVVEVETLPFSGVEVELWVERSDPSGDPPDVSSRVQVEVRADVNELKPPLYLSEGLGLTAGAELILRAIDSATGRELARIPLRLEVDWE